MIKFSINTQNDGFTLLPYTYTLLLWSRYYLLFHPMFDHLQRQRSGKQRKLFFFSFLGENVRATAWDYVANLSSNINRVERKEGRGGREGEKKEPQIQNYEETHLIWNSAISYKNTLELEFQNELVFYFCLMDSLQLNNPRQFSGTWLHLSTWVFWDQQYDPGVKSTQTWHSGSKI